MKEMTVEEFLRTPNTYPLTGGGRYIPVIMRAIPPDVELTDLNDTTKCRVAVHILGRIGFGGERNRESKT